MACRYTYKGKTYEAWEFEDVLQAMSPAEASAFIPSVKAVPDAPFIKNTDAVLNLALKRIVKMAVDGGYDKVAFVNGEQSADRYDLSKEIRNVEWTQYGSGTKVLSINPKSGNAIELLVEKDGTTSGISGRDSEFSGKPLGDVVGKEIAEKIMAERSGDLSGDGLKVGGEGMKTFYNAIVPNATKALLKKLGGGQMGTVTIETEPISGDVPGDTPISDDGLVSRVQPAFTITDAMREKASGGLPMFKKQLANFSQAAKTQSVQAVEDLASSISAAWENGPRIVVAFDMNDARIPERVRQEDQRQRSGGATGDPEGFYYDGTAYLLASQLTTPNDIARVLFHEALGHYGLRKVFGGSLKPILQQIATMRKAQVDAKIKEYGLRGVKNLDRLTAAEEVLAEMAQTTPEIGFVKRAIAAIRNWLRKNVPGFKDLALTDNDIIQAYILPARRYVEGGGGAGGLIGGLAFSRDTKRPVTNPNDVVGNQGGRSADDNSPGVTLYHGSPESGLTAVHDKISSLFGGVFASAIERSARSHGDNLYRTELPESSILTQRDLDYDIAREDIEEALKQSMSRLSNADLEAAYQAVIDDQADRIDGDELMRIFKEDDVGSASWEAQRIRGQVAKRLGYKAVEMNDEHGTSYLLLPGVKLSNTNEPTAPDSDGAPMFSRAATVNDLKQTATNAVNDFVNTPGKLNWWHKTVGTQYNLAQRSPEFKRVFEAVQSFINDVSYYATEAADKAPTLLPKLETWRDIAKSPVDAKDAKAIAAPIFEGTLIWGRDESGKPVKMQDLEAAADVMTVDQKSQRLIRSGNVSEGVMKMWRGLPIDQYESIINGKYATSMLKEGVVWTDAELKSMFNLSKEQISMYREFRKATDQSLTNLSISDMLYVAGKDAEPIRDAVMEEKSVESASEMLRDYLMSLADLNPDRKDELMATANKIIEKSDQVIDLMDRGYAPLSRFGQYTLDIVDKGGERVYFGLFENRFDAAKMARDMQSEYPDAKVVQGTLSQESYKLFSGVSPETVALFGNMMGLEENEAFQQYVKLSKSNRSAMKRLIQRKGIAGFNEDAGRVLAGFVYSNARQTSQNIHAGEMSEAAQAIPNRQGELKDAAVQLVDYIKNPQEEAQAIRGLLFAQYIGGSVASAAVNMTQPLTMTLPWLSQFGGIVKAGAQLTRAMKDIGKQSTGDKALDDSLKRAEEDGTVSPQEVHELMRQSQGKGALQSGDGTVKGQAVAVARNSLSRIGFAWGKLFSAAEQFNRRVTYIAAYRTAVDQKIADPDAFARKAIHETQGIYNKGNKPKWARGPVGATLFTFKQYSVAYVEMMHRMASQGGPEGKRAALYGLGILLLLSGVGGAPGADDLDDLLSGALQSMGYNFDSKAARRRFLAEYLGNGGAEFVDRGISGISGVPIDVSGRLGLGNLIPGTGLLTKKQDHTRDVAELAGPAGDLFKRGFEAAGKVLTGDIVGQGGAVSSIAPRAAANLFQAADMATTGMYRDGRGKKVIETDGIDAFFKALGFQPNDVKQVQDNTFEIQRMVGLNKLRESEIADKWAAGLFERDESKVQKARDELSRWNEDNPESPIRINPFQIAQRVRAMNMSKSERIAKTAPKELRQQVRQALDTQ